MDPVLQLHGMPRWNHRLLQPQEVEADHGIDITAHRCASCGFVSVPMGLTGDYYDDYVNVPSYSPQAQRFQTEQAAAFVSRFGLVGRRVLEVGCGDGFFLGALDRAGAHGFGIEPSASQCKLARARGLSVELGLLTGQRLLAAAPFDAFVTRQVFEHVEDMRDFLLSIRANLRPGAVGLVEVPNLDQLAAEGRFFDFIPEHINYFTPRTLTLALELAGYEVLDVEPVQEGESLRATVRWPGPPAYEALASRVRSLRAEITGFLQDCRARGQPVALWGAGGKGLSMMAIADLHDVALLVDADPGKFGLLTPVSHLRVSAPEEIARQGIQAVLVLAPAYEDEIAHQLRTALAFNGRIALAGRRLRVLEPSAPLDLT